MSALTVEDLLGGLEAQGVVGCAITFVVRFVDGGRLGWVGVECVS